MKELQLYGEFEAQLAALEDICNFIPDVSTDEGYDKSKRVALDTGKVLTSLEKSRVEQKAESLKIGKAIDSEAKAIKTKILAFQLPHKEAYKELDNLKKEREANRKAELEERVRVIRELPESMADSDSNGIKMALESLQCEECLDFYEYTQEALKARNASKDKLGFMFADALQSEKDAKELAELRAKQAIQDQKDHDERIAKEASAAAERQAAESKAAEQLAIDQAALAVKQREEAEVRAKNAEAQAKKDSEVAAANAKQQQIQIQKDKEAAKAEAQAKLESNKAHIGRIRKAAKESFMAMGYSEAESKKLVMAISDGKIENITINY